MPGAVRISSVASALSGTTFALTPPCIQVSVAVVCPSSGWLGLPGDVRLQSPCEGKGTLDGVYAPLRICAMARAAAHLKPQPQAALCGQSHSQLRGLTDYDGRYAIQRAGLCQCARAEPAGFLITDSGKEHIPPGRLPGPRKVPERIQKRREAAFHVACAPAIDFSVALCGSAGGRRPAASVGHGIQVAVEKQRFRVRASGDARQHVCAAVTHILYFHRTGRIPQIGADKLCQNPLVSGRILRVVV